MKGQEVSFKELITRAKSGDKSALTVLYEKCAMPLYRYIYIRTRSKEDAEDIVQEAFLKAYEALPGYEARGESLLPFLFTVARNLLINRSKKKHPITMENTIMEAQASEDDASWGTQARELKEILGQAMEVLTDTEREIIELRFFGEQSYAEIAGVLGKREDAIRQHVARSMKKMRFFIENNHFEK